MSVEKFLLEIGGIDNVFKPAIINIGVDDFETNLEKMPKSSEIQNLLYFNINKNKQTRKYFKNNFNCISKIPFEYKSNVDISKYIESFVFDYNNNSINKYIYKILYNKYINLIEDIILENRFDMTWYDMGSVDYTWAVCTLEKAKKKKMLFRQLIEQI